MTARAGLATGFAALDPTDPDATPLSCPAGDAAWAQNIAGECQARAGAFYQSQATAVCDARFAALDAPDGLRTARVALFNYIVDAEDLVCPQSSDPFEVTKEGGFFSSTRHVLTLPMRDDHRLTATLTAPETGDLWTLTDMDITPGGLKSGLDLNDPATLSLCQSTPTACIR